MTYIFDCDSTLINCESLEELAAIALRVKPDQAERIRRMEEITSLGMTGRLDFDESLSRRLKLFSARREHVEELAVKLLDCITPSVWEARDWFRQNRSDIYVISGGFKDYLVPVLEKIGIMPEHIFANEFLYEGENITGYDSSKSLSRPGGKVRQVAELSLPRPVVIIGDGNTDAEIREQGQADEFWAFTEIVNRPSVTAKADRILDSMKALAAMPMEPADKKAVL